MQSVERVENLVRLLLAPGIGCVTVNRLLRQFGTSEKILGASATMLQTVPGVNKAHLKAVLEAAAIDPRPELDLAASRGVQLIAYDDPAFPPALLESADPPFLLYVKGSIQACDASAIGIVGTRQASRYGREQAERFSSGLVRAGYTVISGLARGIDTYAHRGALCAGGRTIAVVGCGLEHIYPPENRDLFSEIAATGAVVSEFPMDVAPTRDTFPRRNRIIAGMSLGVLVVEAPERSGALITAHQALELGREVFAIPGRIDQESCSGCHALIRGGAVLVSELSHILRELRAPAESCAELVLRNGLFAGGQTAGAFGEDLGSPTQSDQTMTAHAPQSTRKERLATPAVRQTHSGFGMADGAAGSGINSKEATVLAVLEREPQHIDDICARVELGVGEVSATLMILELQGRVAQSPGKFFNRLD